MDRHRELTTLHKLSAQTPSGHGGLAVAFVSRSPNMRHLPQPARGAASAIRYRTTDSWGPYSNLTWILETTRRTATDPAFSRACVRDLMGCLVWVRNKRHGGVFDVSLIFNGELPYKNIRDATQLMQWQRQDPSF